ncbi:MAG: aminopeptidase P family protein [Clostridia bacterium]|nr:aminopeptidase P family protein [Clostridia bacterium]
MLPTHITTPILLTHPVNTRYLHHLPMSQGAVYLSDKQRVFLNWGRPLRSPLPNGLRSVEIDKLQVGETINALLSADGYDALEVESSIPHSLFLQLEAFPHLSLSLVEGVAESWRETKDSWEIEQLAQACRITDDEFSHILTLLRPGLTELEVAAELEHSMRLGGADGMNLTIVASGPNSASPHHWPTSRILEKGDFVTMDYGCTVNGYHSDMTRTVVLGKATDEQKRIYNTVLHAQQAAEDFLRAGILSKEADLVARRIIEDAGYPGRFLHNLGHGIGLDIHEGTGLTQTGEGRLQPGMVVSIEPGIYIEGFGGVRIEDIAVVEEDGCNVLEVSDKQLFEL